MSGATAGERREAADEIRGEILTLLGRVVEMTAPVTRNRSQEAAEEKGGTFVVETLSPRTALPLIHEKIARLLWLLGLSDAERAFVEAAAVAVRQGRPGEAYVELAVWCDWLRDQERDDCARTVELLTPADGDVIIITVPSGAGPLAVTAADEMVGAPLKAALERLGKRVHVKAVRGGVGVGRLGGERLRELGWMRVEAHERAFHFLRQSLDGEPEGGSEGGSLVSTAALAMIGRLKRERSAAIADAVREAVRREREACIGIAADNAPSDVADSRHLGAAQASARIVHAIRSRPPV